MKIKHTFLIFCLSIFFCTDLFSGTGGLWNNPRSSGMGNISVMLSDHWSSQKNPAGLAHWGRMSFGACYENRFMVPELAAMGLGVSVPVMNGVMGLSVSSFGYELYGENNIGLAFGKILSEQFSMGIKLNYLSINQGEDYGSMGAVIGEIGVMAKISDEFNLGAHIYNVNRAKIDDYQNERVPSILRIGLGYQMNEKVLLCVEAEKDIDAKARIKVGMDYHIIEPLFIRAGVNTNPAIVSFGFGLIWKRFIFDFSTNKHSVLGYSPQLGLIFAINKD